MFIRILIFLSICSMIAAFFMPYIEITVNQLEVVSATGFDLVIHSQEKIAELSLEQKGYILIMPILGLYSFFAFIKKWHSATYVVPAILALGGYGYLLYENYAPLKNYLGIINNSLGLAKNLASIAGNDIAISFQLIGYGIYIQVAALFLTIILGIKDPLNKMGKQSDAMQKRLKTM